MERNIFVNLPVNNLERSTEFFKEIGFTFDKQFSDKNGTMMIINDKASVMLLTEEFFRSFTKKPVGDAHKTPEVIMALSAGSREEVDAYTTIITEAGGKIEETYNDTSWMYGIRFTDLDGHLWELFYMDMAAMPS